MGETETIWDNLNPDFQKSFTLDFIFEMRQEFRIEVRDMDNKEGTKWDYLGAVEFEMGKLIGAKNNQLILQLSDKGKNTGTVVIRSEKVARNNDILTLYLKCTDIQGFGACSAKKPFIV